MLQKEVAERITAKSSKMNLLAAITQGWADVKIEFKVGRGNFKPSPKVDSAVISLRPSNKIKAEDLPNYFKFCRIIFKQPRKTLANNIRSVFKDITLLELDKIFSKYSIKKDARSESLDLSKIITLFIFFYSRI